MSSWRSGSERGSPRAVCDPPPCQCHPLFPPHRAPHPAPAPSEGIWGGGRGGLQPLPGDDPAPAPLFSTKLGLGPQEEEAGGKQILQLGPCLGSGQGPALHTWLGCDPAPARERHIPKPTDPIPKIPLLGSLTCLCSPAPTPPGLWEEPWCQQNLDQSYKVLI